MARARAGRAAGLALLVALGTSPASALSRSINLLWRFDDITSRDPSGSSRRTSWYQGYNADFAGVLLHPLIGVFQTGGGYAQGADVNTAINEDVPELRTLSYRAAVQPFGPGLRRYFTFDPNYSLQRTRYAPASSSPGHTYTSKSWGLNSGLTLPRLPSLSVSRAYNSLRDPDGLVPNDQRVTLKRESLYYRLKSVGLNFSQERTQTEDLQAVRQAPQDRTQRASLDYGRNEVKRLGLRSLSVRSDYLRLTRGETDFVKTLTNLLSLRSRDFKGRAWTHNLNYWNDSQRDLLFSRTRMAHNGQWNGSRYVRRGTLTNTLSANLATGGGSTSRGLSLAPGANLAFREGRVLTNLTGQAGWSRNSSGGGALSDALGLRVDVRPRPASGVFAEARTSGIEALGDAPGGQRTNRYGLGGDRRLTRGQTEIRFDRVDQRDFANDGRSVSDQVNLNANLNIVERLNGTAGFNFITTKSDGGSRLTSRNARAGLDYAFRWGLRLAADSTFASMEQYASNASASYALGKTALSLRYTRTQRAADSSYSYLSLSLSRSL